MLDRVARLVLPQKPQEPLIFSFYYEYIDYLAYYGFTDPEEIAREEDKRRRQAAKNVTNAMNLLDDEDADDIDLAPEEGGGQGINRFANMMKNMTTRIEMFN